MKKKSVITVVDNKLCCGCGCCASICPSESIKIGINKSYEYEPIIDNTCNNCGICLQVCPGIGGKEQDIKNSLFKENKLLFNKDFGVYKKIFIGHIKDDNIRLNCASGGLLSYFLIYLLEEKLIDGAVVLKIDKKKPFLTKAIIAKNKNDILESAKSKYSPSKYDEAIKIIKSAPSTAKFAFVGLPCQVYAIRKMQLINPLIKDKIKYCFGLFCGHGVSYEFVKYLLKDNKLKLSDVKSIDYRYKNIFEDDFFFEFKVSTIDGNYVINKWLDSSYSKLWCENIFKINRCFLCNDFAAEYSDISFGDAWLNRFKKDSKGNSMIISRTQSGQDIIRKIKKLKKTYIEEVNEDVFFEAHKSSIKAKKDMIQYYNLFQRFYLRAIPNFKIKNNPFNFKIFKKAVGEYFFNKLFEIFYRKGFNPNLKNFIFFKKKLF